MCLQAREQDQRQAAHRACPPATVYAVDEPLLKVLELAAESRQRVAWMEGWSLTVGQCMGGTV